MNLRKWACTAILACAVVMGCNDSDEANENGLVLTPDAAANVDENGGSTTYSVILDEPSKSIVQIQVTISDPNRVQTNVPGNTATLMPGAVMTGMAFHCVDNSVADGDHTVTLTFTTVTADKNLNALTFNRQMTCKDDDTGILPPAPKTCTDGDFECLDDGHYRLCAGGNWSGSTACPTDKPLCRNGECIAEQKPEPKPNPVCVDGEKQCRNESQYAACDSGQWAQTLTACPEDKPICNEDTNNCEEAPVIHCDPQCEGNRIRLCASDGTLEAATDCADGMVCRTTSGQAACTKIQTSSVAFTLSKNQLDIFEGGKGSLTITPSDLPTSTVNVIVSVNDAKKAILAETAYTFKTTNWSAPQTIEISAPRDGKADGDAKVELHFSVSSSDERYHGLDISPVQVNILDTEADESLYDGETTLNIRAMAANITSGNYQSYSPGEGVRIFKALKPDIVMIQEFNWNRSGESDSSAMKLITQAFDSSFYVHRGRGKIPNGIISRYPIIDSGHWESNKINDRDWDWAIVDLPGAKELLVLSVHLSTDDNKAEAPSLMSTLGKKITADKLKNLEYYLMIGGDFNSNYQNNGSLKEHFDVGVALPVDQNNLSTTNATRRTVLDHLFVDKQFGKYEVPAVIGKHSYNHGHVFDSRVYSKHNEIGDVPPVRADDSKATGMQHMPVVRDFVFTLE